DPAGLSPIVPLAVLGEVVENELICGRAADQRSDALVEALVGTCFTSRARLNAVTFEAALVVEQPGEGVVDLGDVSIQRSRAVILGLAHRCLTLRPVSDSTRTRTSASRPASRVAMA